jgi:leucyl aminopeptidase
MPRPMRVLTVERPPAEVEADAIAFALAEGGARLPSAVAGLGDEVVAALTRLVDEREIRGRRQEVTILHAPPGVAATRVIAAGLGKKGAIDPDAVRTASASVARRLDGVGRKRLAWVLDAGLLPPDVQARAIVDGAALGPFDHGRWQSERDDGGVEELILCGDRAAGVAEEARVAGVVAAWTNRCRALVDAPANELTPESLAREAQAIAAGSASLAFEELGPAELEAAGLNLFVAVAGGSRVPPRLVVLRYDPGRARDDLVLGLVGKAITFDSGGLSLKTPAAMEDMKSDMAGGGAALAALGAIAELGLPVRCLAVVAACENMPAGSAVRPGDIVRGLNGTTVEVTNTDAEGRLVLADALVYARNLGATHLVDLATLTGGIVVAMGDVYAAVFSNDDDLRRRILNAGEATGDLVWPWPLHPSYDRYIESPFADVKNSSVLRQGTPAYAARFLQRFAGDGPWAHVDMAGTGYLERGRGDYYSTVGATGFGVRLVAELVQGLAA